MTQTRVTKERFERADREAKIIIETEREARNAKTARLKAQRLSVEVPLQKLASRARRRAPAKKPARKIIVVD